MEKYDIDISILAKQEIKDVNILLKMLCQVSVSDKKALLAIEEKICEITRKNPDDSDSFVALSMVSLMLGNRHKSKAIAQNIWDKGLDIGVIAYILYVDVLVNLGMFEMAYAMLTPKIDNIVESMDLFSRLMTKLAILSGDFVLLKKVSVLMGKSLKKKKILEYIEKCTENGFVSDVKILLGALNVGLKDYVYTYDYSFNKKLKIIVYLGKEIPNKKAFKDNLEMDKLPKKALEVISLDFRDYEKYEGSFC